MHTVAAELGKALPEMTADRKVIAKARLLQQRIAAGDALGGKQAAAHRAIQELDKEAENVFNQRRIDRFRLYQASTKLGGIYSRGCGARNDLAKLMRQHPQLLGDISALILEPSKPRTAVRSA